MEAASPLSRFSLWVLAVDRKLPTLWLYYKSCSVKIGNHTGLSVQKQPSPLVGRERRALAKYLLGKTATFGDVSAMRTPSTVSGMFLVSGSQENLVDYEERKLTLMVAALPAVGQNRRTRERGVPAKSWNVRAE